MTINKIEHDFPHGPRKATITLDVVELCNLNNALYQAIKATEQPSATMLEFKRDFHILFSLVKNGCLDSIDYGICVDFDEKIKDAEARERNGT